MPESDLQVGDVLVHRETQTLWVVIEIEPNLVLRDPDGLEPDYCMPYWVATTAVFDEVFKFAWHYKEGRWLLQ